MITYLYHKRHIKTGLNYFGKTTGNPYTYNGSGVYWNDHLRKHGKEIETVQVWKFDNLEECSKFAIDFSIKNNIVESNEWANLCLENGLDGGDKFSSMDPTKKADIDYRKSIAHKEIWKTRDKIKQSVKTSQIWAIRDKDTISSIADKISKTLLEKTPEQREKTLCKRRETLSRRSPVACSHCGKISKNLSNMKRYHLDNCKLRTTDNDLITQPKI